MARRRTEQFKAFALTAILLVAWWLMPTAFKAFARVSFYEFQAPVWSIASTVRDLQTFWGMRAHSKHDLIEAGRDLSRLNSAYLLIHQRNQSLQREVAELEAVLDLPPLSRHRFEIARVARRELSAWWQELIIRKGEDYGIPEGAAVIYGDGVVGRIKEVHATTSVVELVSSPSFRMAATFEEDTRPVTYQGYMNTALGPAYGYVRDVPSDIQASSAVPKRLISSRLGGVFPAGLKIGEVSNLDLDSNGLFTQGRVRLEERLLDLREVAVLIPLKPEDNANWERADVL